MPFTNNPVSVFLYWLIAAILLLHVSPVQAKDHALLVGVGKFPHIEDGAIDIPGIERDLHNMSVMMQRLDVPAENVITLHNERATASAVIEALGSYTRLAKKDRLFIYFSTHGGQIRNNGDDVEADGYDEFLAFSDLRKSPVRESTGDSDNQGIIRDDALAEILQRISASTIVIIDACASATATRGFAGYTGEKIRKFGKYITAGWMRDDENSFSHGAVHRHRFDTTTRDNLIVMAAAQDHQQAASSPLGSRYTSALVHAAQYLPDERLTPFCLHRSAQLELAGNTRYMHQTPEFSGRFEVANQALLQRSTTTPLRSFNLCLGGREMKPQLLTTQGEQWRVGLYNWRNGYLQAYGNGQSGIQYYRPKSLAPSLSGRVVLSEPIYSKPAVAEAVAGEMLLLNIDDANLANDLDLTGVDWANKINRSVFGVSSAYGSM